MESVKRPSGVKMSTAWVIENGVGKFILCEACPGVTPKTPAGGNVQAKIRQSETLAVQEYVKNPFHTAAPLQEPVSEIPVKIEPVIASERVNHSDLNDGVTEGPVATTQAMDIPDSKAAASEVNLPVENTITHPVEPHNENVSKPLSMSTNVVPMNKATMTPVNQVNGISLHQSVYFAFGSSYLDQDSKDRVVSNMAPIKNQSIVLSGHTDSRGSKQFNDMLADRRARRVMQLLIDNGVPASIISVRSAGLCCDSGVGIPEEVHKLNRRVDISVKKFMDETQTVDNAVRGLGNKHNT